MEKIMTHEKFISKMLENIQNDIDKTLPELVELIIQLDETNKWAGKYEQLKDIANNKENKIRKLIEYISNNCDKELVNKLITNFLVNEVIKGNNRRAELKQMYNITVPKMIDICYDGLLDENVIYLISYSSLEKIIHDGKDLGVYIYNISDIEHYEQRDLLKLALRHPECIFIFNIDYTNADIKFINNCKCMKNVIFMANIKLDNQNMKKQTYKLNIQLLKLLKSCNLVYGLNIFVNSENIDIAINQSIAKKAVENGALFSIYSYDVLTLYNEDVNFDDINNRIFELQQKYPMVFLKNCEFIQNKIEIKINERQTIQVLDLDQTIDINDFQFSIFDIINNKNIIKPENNKEETKHETGRKNNIISFAQYIASKFKRTREEYEDYEDLKAS